MKEFEYKENNKGMNEKEIDQIMKNVAKAQRLMLAHAKLGVTFGNRMEDPDVELGQEILMEMQK